ncbi:MAG TPA: SDR family oxidoreductase [Bacteroidota bacterium]|nr:SDR family oxidoreductase [Bacteroidota bacterium]
MKNVLVTGGTGFIGSNLAAALVHNGVAVRILRRSSSDLFNVKSLPVEHCIGDVRDSASLRSAMKGCDTVFHTAAMVSFWRPLRQLQHEVNVGGTRNVVQACLDEGVKRLVHTSSIAAIGHPSDGNIADETTAFNWQSVDNGYKNSKHLAEKEIEDGVARGLDAVMVNPAVVIGPGDIHFNGGKILRVVKRGQSLFYIKGGMNVAFVDDVVRGHIGAATKGKTGERYILGGENLTQKDVFRITSEIIGGIPPIIRLPVPLLMLAASAFDIIGMILHKEPMLSTELISGAGIFNWYSSAKAQRDIDYSITPFRESVTRTYAWYREKHLL